MAARGLSGRKVVTAFANSRGVNVPTTAAFKHQDEVDKPECEDTVVPCAHPCSLPRPPRRAPGGTARTPWMHRRNH